MRNFASVECPEDTASFVIAANERRETEATASIRTIFRATVDDGTHRSKYGRDIAQETENNAVVHRPNRVQHEALVALVGPVINKDRKKYH